MGSHKVEVFIASRFDEVMTLREALAREIAKNKHMAPIDLNDGFARHRPPLSECLARVRAAEFMVLLLGDTYGPSAPGRDQSFSHLEYAEAVREGSKTRVLVYRVKGRATPGERAIPERWLRELEERHTCCPLRGDDPAAQASEIAKHLGAALYDLRFGEVSEEEEEDDGTVDEPVEDAFDDSEVQALDAAEALARGEEVGSRGDPDGLDAAAALRGPAAAAALEQRLEAVRGTALGEYGIAIQHLKKALELRPLDGLSNFLLARLYVATARRDRLGEAANLADRAARIASDEQLSYRACLAHIVAARARTELGDIAGAHLSVDRALELESDFAQAHLERARILCREDRSREAIEAVRVAFQYHNPSLHQALRDPHLVGVRGSLRDLLHQETARWREEVQRLLGVERQLREVVGELAALDEGSAAAGGLQRLRRLGRESVTRQRDLVSAAVTAAEAALLDSRSERRDSAAAACSNRIAEGERLLSGATSDEATGAREVEEAGRLPSLVDWRTFLPLVVGGLLAYQVPATWAAVGIGIGGVAVALRYLFGSWRRLVAARAHVAGAEARLAATRRRRVELEEAVVSERGTLEALRDRAERSKDTARQVLSLFEGRSLSMPGRYQPYAPLRRASPGKLVRVSARIIDQFQRTYGRQVERDDTTFWGGAEENSEGVSLYRVAQVSPGAICLSRARAYQPDSGPLRSRPHAPAIATPPN